MLGIVLRSWNAYEYTCATLNSLLQNTVGEFTIVIVDNGSEYVTIKRLEDFCLNNSQVTLIKNNKNLGVSLATNIGIESLDTEMICIIDNDVLVPYGWNTDMENEMKKCILISDWTDTRTYLSTAILFNAVLSSTTTASAFSASLFRVRRELYGCTTTSGALSQFGNTE